MIERLGTHPGFDSPHIAVAIRRVPTNGPPPGLHIGIGYKKADGELSLLHLQFHRRIADEALSDRYALSVPDVPAARLRSVAALCRLVARNYINTGLPYALQYDRSHVFSTDSGKRLSGNGGKGFTCATFVLALFESCGLSLIDLATWGPRSSDRAWQQYIIECLRNDPAYESEEDVRHIDGVAAEVGCLRFRPDEVAGGCLATEYPATSLVAISAGMIVLEHLDRHYEKIGYRT
jgi:hypothetical protein